VILFLLSFLLVVEYLNVMMNAIMDNGLFSAYHVGEQDALSVTQLQFVHDTLLIGRKSWANVRTLKNVLPLFEKISGLILNFHKSMLFGIDVAGFWLHEVAVVMN
jgi:hypothetical protein